MISPADDGHGRTPLNVLACSLDPVETACGQIRVWGPLRHCTDVAIREFRHATFLDDLAWADLVLVQRGFPGPGRVRHFRAIGRNGTPLVYETDDPLHMMAETHPDWNSLGPSIPYIEDVMERSDALIASTPALAELFPRDKPRVVVENAIDEALWNGCEVPRDRSPLRIVFSGTPSRRDDLASCEIPLRTILERHGAGVQLILMGCSLPSLEGSPQVTHVPFASDYAQYARALRDLHAHIAVMPLLDTPFNRTKSAIKWLEMSACGIAGVYADLPPYRSAVLDGETGLLAPSSAEAWIDALERLVVDHELRERIAHRARREVFEKHTQALRGPQLALELRHIVDDVSARRGRRRGVGLLARIRYQLDI